MHDYTTNFYDFVEHHGNALGAIVGGHGAAPAAGRATRAANASYLETTGKDCEQKPDEEKYVLHAVGCRSWFCKRCCLGRGLALRKRLTHHFHFLKNRAQLLRWVRGFYFPEATIIAVRTFFNPTQLGIAFGTRHTQIVDVESQQFVGILRRKMPGVRYVTGVDNQWLDAYFPRMCAW